MSRRTDDARPRPGIVAQTSIGLPVVGRTRWQSSLTLGGVLVIAGIAIAIFWSLILGIIVTLIGLVAFGGFARGRWY